MKLPDITVAYFHKETNIRNGEKIVAVYPKKSLAAVPYFTNKNDLERLQEGRTLEMFNIDMASKRYDVNQGRKILFTHLGGGIGDIIAYSAIGVYLKDLPLTVYIDKKFFPIVQWWARRTALKSYYDPIYEKYSPIDLKLRYKDYRRLYMEYAAIEGGRDNWYDAMFRRIGLTEAPEGFARPHLRNVCFLEKQVPANSILIKHKSSCQMRSSLLEDFFVATRAAYPTHKIYVDAVDLTNAEDIAFVNRKDVTINIIKKQSLEEHLTTLGQFGLVVSTDSYAIHFREGLGLPCVGVFGAISGTSRASGYKYTSWFNAQSKCPYQPCYIHETVKGLVCPSYKGGARVAPCQTGEEFREQLIQHLKTNK